MVDFNQTWDDRVSKYTINLPKEVRVALEKRKDQLGYRYKCDYILALILKDLDESHHLPVAKPYNLKYPGFQFGRQKKPFVINCINKLMGL